MSCPGLQSFGLTILHGLSKNLKKWPAWSSRPVDHSVKSSCTWLSESVKHYCRCCVIALLFKAISNKPPFAPVEADKSSTHNSRILTYLNATHAHVTVSVWRYPKSERNQIPTFLDTNFFLYRIWSIFFQNHFFLNREVAKLKRHPKYSKSEWNWIRNFLWYQFFTIPNLIIFTIPILFNTESNMFLINFLYQICSKPILKPPKRWKSLTTKTLHSGNRKQFRTNNFSSLIIFTFGRIILRNGDNDVLDGWMIMAVWGWMPILFNNECKATPLNSSKKSSWNCRPPNLWSSQSCYYLIYILPWNLGWNCFWIILS